MSDNIQSVVMLTNENLRMRAEDVLRVMIEYEDAMPEHSFIEDLENALAKHVSQNRGDYDPGLELPIKRLSWLYAGSSDRFDTLTAAIAPLLRGKADVVFQLASGRHIGLRVDDGTVERRKVVFALGEPE